MRKRQHHAAGFSLVEVIVALGLVATVMMSIATLYIQAIQKIASAGRMTVATTLAQGIIEDLARLPADDLVVNLQGAAFDPTATVVESDTRVAGSVAGRSWGAAVGSRLHRGYALIRLEPAGHMGGPVLQAQGVRLSVTVFWAHRNASRSIMLQRVRF